VRTRALTDGNGARALKEGNCACVLCSYIIFVSQTYTHFKSPACCLSMHVTFEFPLISGARFIAK
jgi:hypothetical protein